MLSHPKGCAIQGELNFVSTDIAAGSNGVQKKPVTITDIMKSDKINPKIKKELLSLAYIGFLFINLILFYL